MEEVKLICFECGEEIEEESELEIDSKSYCSECAAECGKCGDVFLVSDLKLTPDEEYLCNDCGTQCSDCEEYFRNRDVFTDNRGTVLCDNCREHYLICYCCENFVREDSYVHCEYCDNNYCERCYERHDECSSEEQADDRNIHNHDYKPHPRFYGMEKNSTLYMGVELEIDQINNRENLADFLVDKYDKNFFYLKEDGSLSNGFEIVTEPCSLTFHKNSFGWKEVLGDCLHKATSHNNGKCGLHVHVNKTFFGDTATSRDLAEIKILFLFDKLWGNMVKFSRRTDCYYCQKISNGIAEQTGYQVETVKLSKTLTKNMKHCNRYYAINIQNSSTIEFRLWRGTLNRKSFLATLEFTDAICRVIKNMSIIKLQQITWDEFIGLCLKANKYDYLEDYLKSKSLLKGE